jgi:hypothetical protein
MLFTKHNYYKVYITLNRFRKLPTPKMRNTLIRRNPVLLVDTLWYSDTVDTRGGSFKEIELSRLS